MEVAADLQREQSVSTHTHTHARTPTHTHTHARPHTHTHAHTHTHTHTHTQTVHHQRHHGEAKASEIDNLKKQIDYRDQFLERAGLHLPADEADEQQQLHKKPGKFSGCLFHWQSAMSKYFRVLEIVSLTVLLIDFAQGKPLLYAYSGRSRIIRKIYKRNK